MNENIDFIVLEHDDDAGCALIVSIVDGTVPAIDGYNTPYIVAEGYDHADRDWEDCRLFDDIGKAKLAYEKLRGRDYSLDADMPDSIAFKAKHADIGTDDYRAKDFYKNAYRLIDDSYAAIAWRSEDRSLAYLAVADKGNELSVLHFPTRSWKARSRRRPPRWTPSPAIFAARSCSIGASCCVPKRRAGCTSLAAARWKRGAATRRPWPPRPRRPRLSTAAAPSSTEATSISKPAAGNASRRPIR